MAEKEDITHHVPLDQWFELERRLEILSRMTTEWEPLEEAAEA